MPTSPKDSQILRFVWLDKGFDFATHLVKWAGIIFVVYFAKEMVSDLAGKTTLTDIAVKILMAGNARELVSYGIAGGAIGWGWSERRLRKSKIRHLGKRLVATETSLDPNRSSSQLTDTGETRPEDQ